MSDSERPETESEQPEASREPASASSPDAPPPSEEPPSEAPLSEEPPSEAPPSEAPLSEEPPSEAPPSEEPPSEDPYLEPISDEAPIVRPRAPLPTPTPAPSNAARANSPTGRYLREGIVGALRQPFLRSLLKIPLKKVAIWASFLFLIYALRDFFGLIFLTFVISYISAAIVGRISPHFTNRKVPVVLVFSAIIGAVVSLGLMTVPRAVRQGEAQLEKLRKIKDFRGFLEAEIAKRFGAELPHPSPAHAPGATPPAHPAAGVAEVGSALVGGQTPTPAATPPPSEEEEEPQIGLLERARRVLNNPDVNQAVAKMLAKGGQEYLIPNLKSVVQGIWGGAAYFVAALIFSFMIVWDLPRLASGAGKMEQSRLGDVWVEVAPSIATFFRLLGKAFEAQTVIALVNTAITALGMWFLGIPGIPFLAVIVFVCSFIPIVGMFISTIPICIVALQVGGFGLVFGVIIMVAVAHALEAYVLNPRIYGFHMKLHPLAVLIVLYLGQHLFGVWGLVIGVPMATYIWRHLIMGEADEVQSVSPEDIPLADQSQAPAPGSPAPAS